MQRLPILTLSLTLSIALTACAGSDGTDGAVGPQGEQGQAAQVQDLDVIAQMVVEDPAFRAKIVQLLVEQHAEELKGSKGTDGVDGECDCEADNPPERGGTCERRCADDTECGNQFGCRDGVCTFVGCDDSSQCGSLDCISQ